MVLNSKTPHCMPMSVLSSMENPEASMPLIPILPFILSQPRPKSMELSWVNLQLHISQNGLRIFTIRRSFSKMNLQPTFVNSHHSIRPKDQAMQSGMALCFMEAQLQVQSLRLLLDIFTKHWSRLLMSTINRFKQHLMPMDSHQLRIQTVLLRYLSLPREQWLRFSSMAKA